MRSATPTSNRYNHVLHLVHQHGIIANQEMATLFLDPKSLTGFSFQFRQVLSHFRELVLTSNSHYETDFGVSSAYGAGNTKIGFLKASLRLAFKKPIFIMRIAGY
jgi:hypothetical protein